MRLGVCWCVLFWQIETTKCGWVLLCAEVLLFSYPFIFFIWKTIGLILKGKCKELGLGYSTSRAIFQHLPFFSGLCKYACGLHLGSWNCSRLLKVYLTVTAKWRGIMMQTFCFCMWSCVWCECNPWKFILLSSPSSFNKNKVSELNFARSAGGCHSFVIK